jgi:uncharacterized protein (TIGR02996 family)
MTQENAFLQAIIDAPDDEVPRLVFADWLEEHGDSERAEFIRLQCRLADMMEEDPLSWSLKERERDLLTAHGERWLGPLREVTTRAYVQTFRRGLLHKVCTTADCFLQRGDLLFRGPYPIRRAALCRTWEVFPALVGSPLLAELTELDLGCDCVNDDRARALAASPHVGNLTNLVLGNGNAFAFPDEHFYQERNCVEDSGVAALAACPRLSRLRSLDLSDNHFGRRGVRTLGSSPHLSNLVTLVLWNNAVGPEGTAALADSPNLRHLEVLNLRACRLDDAGVQALASSPHLTALRVLDLRENGITASGALALASSPVFARLGTLLLAKNNIRNEGAQALAASPHLTRLRFLDLGQNQIHSAGARALAASPSFASLALLDLRDNRIGDKGARALFASPGLQALATLNLRNNKITDDGLQALHDCRLPRLASLDLSNDHCNSGPNLDNRFTEAGATALSAASGLESLLWLRLPWQLGEAAKQALRSRFGDRVHL